MIAVWMMYTLVSGALIAIMCWLLEHIARAARLPTRGIWAAGMVMMLLIPAAAFVRNAPDPPASWRTGTSGMAAQTAVEIGGQSTSQSPGSPLGEYVANLVAVLDSQLTVVAAQLSPWDRPLLVVWAVLAAFLAGVVAHAAVEGWRLRVGLQPREIAGTSVLLTESVGPSAIGVGGPAILMPRWALDLEDELVALIVRHEREHLAARDPLLLLAMLLGVVLVPWHLPLWWSRKRLRLAVEVDCDSRVLRAHPDVRRYAQLLLLTAQRSPRTAWANLPVTSVVAPLRPHASHLAERISAMTQPRSSRLLLSAAPLCLGAAAILSLVLALPAPPRAQAQAPEISTRRAIVRLTEVGLIDAFDPISIVVYTTGGAQVGIGIRPPSALADTLRLDHLPAITADVTDGEVHVELRSPGRIRMGGEVNGGPALRLEATGRHLVLREGGTGISSRP